MEKRRICKKERDTKEVEIHDEFEEEVHYRMAKNYCKDLTLEEHEQWKRTFSISDLIALNNQKAIHKIDYTNIFLFIIIGLLIKIAWF